MSIRSIVYCLLCAFLFFFTHQSYAKTFNSAELSRVPVLHEGRVKPFDTFARVHLLAIQGKQTIPGLTPTEWLVELLFDSSVAYKRKIFNINSPDSRTTLKLERREGHKYSFVEVATALQSNLTFIRELSAKNQKLISPSQRELVDLYVKVIRYYEISRSFSLAESSIPIFSSVIRDVLELPDKKSGLYSYLDLMKSKADLNKIFSKRDKKNIISADTEKELSLIQNHINSLLEDASSVFQIFPSQFQKSNPEWNSPWALVLKGQQTPWSSQYFSYWENLIHAHQTKNETLWANTMNQIVDHSKKIPAKIVVSWKLNLELLYNQIDFFFHALVFSILSFLAFCFKFLGYGKRLFARVAIGSLAIGGTLNLLGVCFRMIIMARPPVTTLYESIVFVALVVVFFGFFLERKRKDQLGIFLGAVCASVLHFIALGYASEGDSMGVLVAVLDTNFWLATHVVTITIGYGACFVGGLLGHAYLFINLFKYGRSQTLRGIYKNMYGVALVALFFSLFGTILGGIWADQSWGRFWGWDPKENGALLIVLWLLWLIHGRLAGKLKAIGFSLGLLFGNIIVALAWFGVNLLNVGLHSYGFTENIAFNLGLFCGLEALLGVSLYLGNKDRRFA